MLQIESGIIIIYYWYHLTYPNWSLYNLALEKGQMLENVTLSESEIYEHAIEKASYYKQFPNRILIARTWEAISLWILQEGITGARNHIKNFLSTCIVDEESRSAYQEWWTISRPTSMAGWIDELIQWWCHQYMKAYEDYCHSTKKEDCWYYIGRGAGYYRAMQHIKRQEDSTKNDDFLLALLGSLQKEMIHAQRSKYSLSIENPDDISLKMVRFDAEIAAYKEAILEIEDLLS